MKKLEVIPFEMDENQNIWDMKFDDFLNKD